MKELSMRPDSRWLKVIQTYYSREDVLLQKAKDSVRIGGYDFKKGKSRSKFSEPSDPKRERTSEMNLSGCLRQNTLQELKLTSERLKEQIEIKERKKSSFQRKTSKQQIW